MRRLALRFLIASIVVSGVAAIVVLVSGEMSTLHAKVLLSALSTSGASILGMACGAAWDRDRWRRLAIVGVGLTGVTLALTLFAFWVEPEPIETVMRWVGSGWLISTAFAHGALLSLARTDRLLAAIRTAALVLGFALALGIVFLVWSFVDDANEAYFRGLGVVGVLMLMGSLSLPVLGRLRDLPAEDNATGAAPAAVPMFMPLELSSLRKSVDALVAVLARSEDTDFMASLDEVARNAIRAGAIRHFEFTYELCWKFMKRWLATNISPNAADGVTRRELFRLAAEQRLIVDVEQWMRHHAARNETSHIYDPEIADRVYDAALDFAGDARSLLEALEARND